MTAVLLVALLALVGLAVDGGRAVAARQIAMDDAGEAARSGADALSVSGIRAGVVEVAAQQAIEAARQYLAGVGASGTVQVSDQDVTVTVESKVPTTLLGIIGIHTMTVTTSVNAVDLYGVTRGD